MDRGYYKQYHDLERTHWWFKIRSEIIINHCQQLLQGVNHPRILNIGVATGYLSEKLMNLGEVESVEFDQDCFEFTKSLGKIKILQGSILNLPFSDLTFDLVCAFDVVEHVEDDKKAIQEMNRVSGKDGKILITVPAYMSLWSQHDEINHHFRRYTKTELSLLFNKDKIIFCSYFNTLLFIPIFCFRQILNVLISLRIYRIRKRSDFGEITNPFINRALEKIFSLEINYLRSNSVFPFGVSILFSCNRS